MRIVLGIDGGGTQTQSCIADETGRVLATASAGPGNFQTIGIDRAVANLLDAERKARAAAGLGSRRYDAAFLGLAGAGTPADRATLLPHLSKLPVVKRSALAIDHDMRIAHAGALAGRPGIVVIAGTGSAVFGMNKAGDTARACGWGSTFDDPGSAYDLGRRAISEVIAVADGRTRASTMSREITKALSAFSEPDSASPVSDKLRTAVLTLGPTGEGRARVAALAPLVINAAAVGDAAARGVVREAVKSLALGVMAVVNRLSFKSNAIEAAIVGGLTRGGKAYLKPLHLAIRRVAPRVKFVPTELSPVLGAVVLALRCIGVNAGRDLIDALKKGI